MHTVFMVIHLFFMIDFFSSPFPTTGLAAYCGKDGSFQYSSHIEMSVCVCVGGGGGKAPRYCPLHANDA